MERDSQYLTRSDVDVDENVTIMTMRMVMNIVASKLIYTALLHKEGLLANKPAAKVDNLEKNHY